MMRIAIYVGNLRQYNEGTLCGEWINLPADDLDDVLARLSNGGEDELHISDYDAPFKVAEYADIHELNEVAEAAEDVDEGLFAAVCEELPADSPMDVLRMIEGGKVDVYYVESLAELAEQFVDDGLFGDIPDAIRGYLDYDAIGRDLGFDGYTETGRGFIIRIE